MQFELCSRHKKHFHGKVFVVMNLKSTHETHYEDCGCISDALKSRIKELEFSCADFSGRNVTLHIENLNLKRQIESKNKTINEKQGE